MTKTEIQRLHREQFFTAVCEKYPGTVVDYDPYELRHKVEYAEDGVKEFLSLWKEDVTIPAGETLGPTHPEADEAGADLLMGLMTGA